MSGEARTAAIHDYRAAFYAATGKPSPYRITYEHGWYVFRYPSGFVVTRHRAAAFDEMREALWRRVPRPVQGGAA